MSQGYVSTPVLESPDLVFDKLPASRNITPTHKSLPALGHDNDQLDEELQQLADSLGEFYDEGDNELSVSKFSRPRLES